ncbi:DRBM domain-containing protein [Caenorhabditis elegans]|uniref:DRBM domain-containing protein n=1 Tax=Caenorhabditis elegans TaxID=6239 RepID=A0A0K3ARY7_CAEEL|nr:DRBM domain-containing protein [Caenorhabditis elegans]CTQ86781.1 DRBM domain-containing protein [Caenorhabditis elegans]|eukprot:NP_001300082.1 Uncharacterized protein CELE_F16H6.4 [Caenorhabditis elegans]
MMENDAEGEIADMLSMCNKYPDFDDEERVRRVDDDFRDVITVFDAPFEGKSPSPAVIVFDELVDSDGSSKYLNFKMEQSYEKVDEIPEKIDAERIRYAIHLGSHSQKNVLQIFQSAYSDGYTEEDKNGKVPVGGKVKCAETETGFRTKINCENVVTAVNEYMDSNREKFGELRIETLNKAERNLDGYIYFSFLKQKPCRNLFIRIPPLEHEKKIATDPISSPTKLHFISFFFLFLVSYIEKEPGKMMEIGAQGDIADMLTMCNNFPGFEAPMRYMIENSHDVVTVFDGSPAVIVLDELVKADESSYLPFKMKKSYKKVDEIAAKMASEEIHFTIHLSSHSQKNVIQIFQSAYSDGYTEEDKKGKIPEGGRVKCAGTETGARSNVKCEEVAKEVNEYIDSNKDKFGDLKVESLGKADSKNPPAILLPFPSHPHIL